MSTTANELISACFQELKLSQRFEPYIQQSEEEGFPQLAKFFRALVACETAREALLLGGLPHQVTQTCDYFVCPHCGLIYESELPEYCLVDEIPGVDFITIR